MAPAQSRRDMLKQLGLAGAGLSILANLPEFAMPVLAQGETVVPFSDFPANFNPNPNATTSRNRPCACPGERMFCNPTNTMLPAITGSTIHDGNDTHPNATSVNVIEWATVKTPMIAINRPHDLAANDSATRNNR